jgi:cell division protein FtsB
MSASRPRFNFKQTLLIVMIIGFVFMMMDLNSRLSTLFRLTGQRDQVSTEVAHLQATKEEIQQQIDFANSDAAVGQWARLEHMALPGDKLIVPLPEAQVTPQPAVQPTTTSEKPSQWQVWRELFFGE